MVVGMLAMCPIVLCWYGGIWNLLSTSKPLTIEGLRDSLTIFLWRLHNRGPYIAELMLCWFLLDIFFIPPAIKWSTRWKPYVWGSCRQACGKLLSPKKGNRASWWVSIHISHGISLVRQGEPLTIQTKENKFKNWKRITQWYLKVQFSLTQYHGDDVFGRCSSIWMAFILLLYFWVRTMF